MAQALYELSLLATKIRTTCMSLNTSSEVSEALMPLLLSCLPKEGPGISFVSKYHTGAEKSRGLLSKLISGVIVNLRGVWLRQV